MLAHKHSHTRAHIFTHPQLLPLSEAPPPSMQTPPNPPAHLYVAPGAGKVGDIGACVQSSRPLDDVPEDIVPPDPRIDLVNEGGVASTALSLVRGAPFVGQEKALVVDALSVHGEGVAV